MADAETTVSNEEICYTDHNNVNMTTCFVPASYGSSAMPSIDMEHAPKMLSNITARSLLTILDTTDYYMFVIFYDNSTLFSTKFIYSFREAIKKVHKANFNVLYATIRTQDETKFSSENNINNDVGLRVFIPGLERLKLQFEFSLRTLSSVKELQRQQMLTNYINDIFFRLDGTFQPFNDYLNTYYLERTDAKNEISSHAEGGKKKNMYQNIQSALSNILYEYDMAERKKQPLETKGSSNYLSWVKNTGGIYISYLHEYYNAKQNGFEKLKKMFLNFHSSLRLNKCGTVNICLSTYKKTKVLQHLLEIFILDENTNLGTVRSVYNYFKVGEKKILDKLKLEQGIPTLEEINKIKDPLKIVQLLKRMDIDEKKCKMELQQEEENVINIMFDSMGQRESQTKQRLHMIRTTTDRGAKPSQQQGRIYQRYAAKYSACKLYPIVTNDLNRVYSEVESKYKAEEQTNIDYADAREVPDM